MSPPSYAKTKTEINYDIAEIFAETDFDHFYKPEVLGVC